MRTQSILLLEYRGRGRVRFYNNITLEGTFRLQQFTGGVCLVNFSCLVQAQINEFRLFNELVYGDTIHRNVKRTNFEASLMGSCDDGGNQPVKLSYKLHVVWCSGYKAYIFGPDLNIFSDVLQDSICPLMHYQISPMNSNF